MTNKEHLVTLTPSEWMWRVDWLFHQYGKAFTDTWPAIMDWLEKEYTPVTPMRPNDPDAVWYYCPVCYSVAMFGDKKCSKCQTDLDWSKYK